jgi:hypothetical protein
MLVGALSPHSLYGIFSGNIGFHWRQTMHSFFARFVAIVVVAVAVVRCVSGRRPFNVGSGED